MAFIHRLRVRYGEVDAQGVVFNANWLAYLDDAMTRFVAHLGYEPRTTFAPDGPWDVMLVKATIEWRAPVGYDDEVAIEVRPVRLGTSSFDLGYLARVDDRDAVEATVTYVTILPATGRPQPIPADLRERLQAGASGG